MEIGETVTFWRNCPDCKGRGVLTTRALHPDASMVFHPMNLRQCPRCVEEKERLERAAELCVHGIPRSEQCATCELDYPSGFAAFAR